MSPHTLGLTAARRLALVRAGLLKPELTGMPRRAAGSGLRARRAALAVIRRFGYLQLDSVSVAGARSHVIVLLSRLEGFDPALGERLLCPGEPLFEYWGHEASWLPIELYPLFGFRRRAFRKHPWWGDVVDQHRSLADRLLRRIRDHGPLRSADMEGAGSRGWWQLKLARRVASALWSSGELAVRERSGFQRSWDLSERVIPEPWRGRELDAEPAVDQLVLKALDGHGWATAGTLARTWRLSRARVDAALERLEAGSAVVACTLSAETERRIKGWIRPADLELAARLERLRPRTAHAVLLSPFDPLLWDRRRVQQLFGFDQVLEIFKPAAERRWGYYCLPVLAGERLVARFDLKAERRQGRLRVLSAHFESPRPEAAERQAARAALERYARQLELEPRGWP